MMGRYWNGYYYYYYTYETQHARDLWRGDVAVAAVFLVLAIYMVWRLARGMWLDRFQQQIRTLRQVPGSRLRQTVKTDAVAPRSGILQISLLPLMLLSTGCAMLIAQARRPDDLSRPVTWGLFVLVGTWYSIHAWRRHRGVGPLRNCALAGAVSGVLISMVLWAFYMTVDFVRAEEHAAWRRITGTVPTLLWWTALGGVIGSVLGSWRANRFYQKHMTVADDVASTMDETGRWSTASGDADSAMAPPIESRPRSRRHGWGALAMACCASLLFHFSAAPHIYDVVNIKRWVWYDYYHHNNVWNNSLQLTMASVDADTLAASDVIATVGFAMNDLPPGNDAPGNNDLGNNDPFFPHIQPDSDPAPLAASTGPSLPSPVRRVLVAARPIEKGEVLALAGPYVNGNLVWADSALAAGISDGNMVSSGQMVASRSVKPGQLITKANYRVTRPVTEVQASDGLDGLVVDQSESAAPPFINGPPGITQLQSRLEPLIEDAQDVIDFAQPGVTGNPVPLSTDEVPFDGPAPIKGPPPPFNGPAGINVVPEPIAAIPPADLQQGIGPAPARGGGGEEMLRRTNFPIPQGPTPIDPTNVVEPTTPIRGRQPANPSAAEPVAANAAAQVGDEVEDDEPLGDVSVQFIPELGVIQTKGNAEEVRRVLDEIARNPGLITQGVVNPNQPNPSQPQPTQPTVPSPQPPAPEPTDTSQDLSQTQIQQINESIPPMPAPVAPQAVPTAGGYPLANKPTLPPLPTPPSTQAPPTPGGNPLPRLPQAQVPYSRAAPLQRSASPQGEPLYDANGRLGATADAPPPVAAVTSGLEEQAGSDPQAQAPSRRVSRENPAPRPNGDPLALGRQPNSQDASRETIRRVNQVDVNWFGAGAAGKPIVSRVVAGSPADKLGLQLGDEIVDVSVVVTLNLDVELSLEQRVKQLQLGANIVSVSVKRNGKKLILSGTPLTNNRPGASNGAEEG